MSPDEATDTITDLPSQVVDETGENVRGGIAYEMYCENVRLTPPASTLNTR